MIAAPFCRSFCIPRLVETRSPALSPPTKIHSSRHLMKYMRSNVSNVCAGFLGHPEREARASPHARGHSPLPPSGTPLQLHTMAESELVSRRGGIAGRPLTRALLESPPLHRPRRAHVDRSSPTPSSTPWTCCRPGCRRSRAAREARVRSGVVVGWAEADAAATPPVQAPSPSMVPCKTSFAPAAFSASIRVGRPTPCRTR